MSVCSRGASQLNGGQQRVCVICASCWRMPTRKSSPDMLGYLPFLICTHVSRVKQQFWDQAGKSLREP